MHSTRPGAADTRARERAGMGLVCACTVVLFLVGAFVLVSPATAGANTIGRPLTGSATAHSSGTFSSDDPAIGGYRQVWSLDLSWTTKDGGELPDQKETANWFSNATVTGSFTDTELFAYPSFAAPQCTASRTVTWSGSVDGTLVQDSGYIELTNFGPSQVGATAVVEVPNVHEVADSTCRDSGHFDGFGPGEFTLFGNWDTAAMPSMQVSGTTGLDPNHDPIAWQTPQLSFDGYADDLFGVFPGQAQASIDIRPALGLPACSDGVDNDQDGRTDYSADPSKPGDPGCTSATDDNELGTNACDNGVDDDHDGLTDTRDPGCVANPAGTNEVPPPVATFTGAWRGQGYELDVDATASTGTAPLRFSWVAADATSTDPQGAKASIFFPQAGKYPVDLVVTDAYGQTASSAAQFVVNAPALYAPEVRLVPGEDYDPDSADDYILHSKLIFDHGLWTIPVKRHALQVRCPTHLIATSVDARRLGQAASDPYSDQQLRRKVTATHRACTLFGHRVTTKTYSVPDADGDGRPSWMHQPEGFSLEPPESELFRRGDHTLHAPVYYEYVEGRYIVYWFFYPYNGYHRFGVSELHEGDWEHIVVRVDKDENATDTAYAFHDCPITVQEDTWAKTTRVDETHPVVYSAAGGHASYRTPGKQGVRFVVGPLHKPCNGPDVTSDAGARWDTWKYSLVDARSEPWYGFEGGWGHKHSGVPINHTPPEGPTPNHLKAAVPAQWR